jgi:hypothetical protein
MPSTADESHPFRASPDPEDLGLPRITADQVLGNLQNIHFGPAMMMLTTLAGCVFHHSDDPRYQLELAAEFYEDRALVDRLRGFIESEAGMLVFDERYVTVLQRLLIEHAAESAIDANLTSRERNLLLTCLLATPGLVSSRAPEAPAEKHEDQLLEWLAFTVQGGAYFENSDLASAIARAHVIFQELPKHPSLAGHQDACPIDDWMLADHGLSIGDQIAAGFAAAIQTKSVDPDASLHERRVALTPGWIGGALGAQQERLVDMLAMTRSEFQSSFGEAGASLAHLSWDRAPFEQRPFLRTDDDRMVLISPRMLVSWFTQGIYYRALDCAKRRPLPDRLERTHAEQLTRYVGVLSELYVVEETREVFRDTTATVEGEIDYSVGKAKKKSPDLVIFEGSALVAIEIFSGRLTRRTKVEADDESVGRDLSKLLVKKLRELSNAINDVLAGHVPYVEPAVDAETIWPLLILVGGGVVQLPVLWRWLESELTPEGAAGPNVFTDSRVMSPTIATLDDYEPMVAVCEDEGLPLSTLLGDYQASSLREFSPRNWVRATHPKDGPTRPRFVQAAYGAAVRDMNPRLGVPSEE